MNKENGKVVIYGLGSGVFYMSTMAWGILIKEKSPLSFLKSSHRKGQQNYLKAKLGMLTSINLNRKR